MSSSSGEDTDASDSEMQEYAEKSYEELKSGNEVVKLSDEAFTCPYCPSRKRKRDYLYNELLQHAGGIGSGGSQKRSAKDKAKHLALAKYLKTDMVGVSTPSQLLTEGDARMECDGDEVFVFPWTGIVVNLPTELKDGRLVGESGSKLRDQLGSRGFNPTRVTPLWNFSGHSGTAIVEFTKDWTGFSNAMSFEKAFLADHRGKKDWLARTDRNSDLYGWVARADDYNSGGIISDRLKRIGDLKTIPDILADEDCKKNMLLSNLKNFIEDKDKNLEDLKSKYEETSNSLSKLIEETNKHNQTRNEELKKIKQDAEEHLKKISKDLEKFKVQMETQESALEVKWKELEKRDTKSESDRKRLAEEMKQNATRNSALKMAAEEQKKLDESLMKLAGDHNAQRDKINMTIIQLQTQLTAKQAVDLEIEKLTGQWNVMKHMVGDQDIEILKKVEEIQNSLREKEEEREDLEALNEALIVKERKSNEELQDARKAFVVGLTELSFKSHIGVKSMGVLDRKPFHDAMKNKYGKAYSDERASDVCSLWEEYLRDPDWHPFKVITVDGNPKEVIDEQDERLAGLKEEVGDKAVDAVKSALREINEYNPSGRYIVSDAWNYEEGRRATLSEGVDLLMEAWKKKRG